MGGISKIFKGPDSPDYEGAAEATAQGNAENIRLQTIANRANQYNPLGSLEWSQIKDAQGNPTDQWEQRITLSPDQQAMFDQNEAIQGKRLDVGEVAADRLMSEYGDPMDWGNLSAYGTTPTATKTTPSGSVNARYTTAGGSLGDPNDFRQAGEDASYQSQMRRITPEYDRAVTAMEVKLRNQGLNPDDRAWQNQMRAMSESYNDAAQSARLTAASEGRAESSLNWGQQLQDSQNVFGQSLAANQQNYGMDMSNNQNKFNQSLAANNQNFDQQAKQAQIANALRQQQFIEQMQQRGFSLNEINAMTSGQQVGMPQFGGYNQAGYAAGPDYAGAAMNQGNFDQGSYQAMWGGLGDLAGAGATAYAGGG